jgi:hypothetical protein
MTRFGAAAGALAFGVLALAGCTTSTVRPDPLGVGGRTGTPPGRHTRLRHVDADRRRGACRR